jgi:hypothetical protein
MSWLGRLSSRLVGRAKPGPEEGDAAARADPNTNPDWIIIPARPIVEEEDEPPNRGQVLRKERSEALLRAQGLPTYAWMPPVAGADEVALRDLGTVNWRSVGLTFVAAKALNLLQGVPRDVIHQEILDDIRRYEVDSAFTPRERNFILDPDPRELAITQFAWRYESAWLLMWAIGRVEEPMGPPFTRVDLDLFREMFWSEAEDPVPRLRRVEEILDQYDLTFRCYWPAQYFHFNDRPQPPGFDRNVLIERYHALEWLIGLREWDEWDGAPSDESEDEGLGRRVP